VIPDFFLKRISFPVDVHSHRRNNSSVRPVR
jgi:hypothetical protein